MALLGFHIVLTLIAASVLQKLSVRFSLGRRILSHGLFRYLHPSTEDLKILAGYNSAKPSTRRRKYDQKNGEGNDAEGFMIAKSANVVLDASAVHPIDVLSLPYYSSFRWLIDFSLCTTVVYGLTEVYRWVFPLQANAEVNLSIVWCLVLIALSLKSLASLSATYFRSSENTGERSLCLSVGAVFFLLSMVFLTVAENAFDVGLTEAHQNFTLVAGEFMKSQQIDIAKYERSPVFLYLLLSVLLGFLAGMLVFPCFRFARMYTDALEYAREDALARLLLHGSFFGPVLVIILWVKPVARDHLVQSDYAVLTENQLYTLRMWAAVFAVLLRVMASRRCLQAYLNLAHAKVGELSKEGGKINSLQLQRMVARIFFFICGAGLQFYVPLTLMLSLVFILKTLGDYSWLTSFGLTATPIPLIGTSKEDVQWQKGDLRASLLSLCAIFNVVVNRGIWGFLLLSTTIITFILNVIGVAYNSRFPS